MKRPQKNAQKRKAILWILSLSYIAFNSCFMFPLVKFSMINWIMAVIGYGIIGSCFFDLLGRGKAIAVFAVTVFFTAVGLLLRYLLEYGEVSNTVNFVSVNIITYITIIPFFCTLVYWAAAKLRSK